MAPRTVRRDRYSRFGAIRGSLAILAASAILEAKTLYPGGVEFNEMTGLEETQGERYASSH